MCFMIIYKLYFALFVILKVDNWKNKIKCKDNAWRGLRAGQKLKDMFSLSVLFYIKKKKVRESKKNTFKIRFQYNWFKLLNGYGEILYVWFYEISYLKTTEFKNNMRWNNTEYLHLKRREMNKHRWTIKQTLNFKLTITI